MKQRTDFYNPHLSDADAAELYEVTPTLEQWKAMQEGEPVEAPVIEVHEDA